MGKKKKKEKNLMLGLTDGSYGLPDFTTTLS
jgi:hypothetical protein